MNCKYCGKEFQQVRSTAKFCCAKCRTYHGRGMVWKPNKLAQEALGVAAGAKPPPKPAKRVRKPKEAKAVVPPASEGRTLVDGEYRSGPPFPIPKPARSHSVVTPPNLQSSAVTAVLSRVRGPESESETLRRLSEPQMRGKDKL